MTNENSEEKEAKNSVPTQEVIVAFCYPVCPREAAHLRVGGPPGRSPSFSVLMSIVCNHGTLGSGMPTLSAVLRVTMCAAFVLCWLSHSAAHAPFTA